MSLPLPEYRATRTIRTSSRSRVYEAVCERDQRVVIAKVFDIEDEADEDRVVHEFELIHALDVEGVVRARELRRVGDQLILLLEHVPGVTLAELADGRPLALPRFWPIAIELAEILARVHGARVVHRDIKPTNILIDSDAGRVWLADFGISVLLESERRHIYDSEVFVGTLPYISPEQTGRTGHAVDFRSDLYSLGVTFFQLLTGRLPFEGLAPLELIHAHLARRPPAPDELQPTLPRALAAVVTKLLTKAPEHRYQTAAGLAADLRALAAADAAGRLDDPDFVLELGSEDLAKTLRLPHQLYGRDDERARLEGALAMVVESRSRHTVGLLGPVGVGKSSLVRELEATVVGYGGYMLHGGFDALRELPYAGFVRAFTRLFEQLLTETNARLERWRARLLDGLGGLASVLAELCPTFELIVGPQDPPTQLDSTAARNRLQLTVERLLAVVCADDRPTVLVVEDVHWAGQESARLLEAIVHADRGPLLVVITLRPEQLEPNNLLHTLTLELEDHPRASLVHLAGLADAAGEALVADALPGADRVRPLARTIARKTGGVPLFVGQFLTQLAEAGLLQASERGWVWDQSAVEAAPIPDDAVGVMRAKLELIDPDTRELITRAACLGARFELARVASICPQPRARVMAALVALEHAGLLARVGSGYSFAHDAIRTAARERLDPELRRELHWTIGRELQAELAGSDEHLFEVVDHLIVGVPAQPSLALRRELAQLTLRAGQRSLDTAAYDLAGDYLERGIALLAEVHDAVAAEGPSAPDYALSFGLHARRAYALALAGRRERADQAFVELLDWPLTERDYAEVVGRRIRVLWVENRHDEALALGREALARLGAPIPEALDDGPSEQLTAAWRALREQDLEAMAALPRCEDSREAAILEVISQLKYPAYVDNSLYLHLVARHALSSFEYGYHPTTPQAIGELSAGVSGVLDQVGDAVRMLDLAVALAERESDPALVPRVIGVNGGLSLHRGRAIREVVDLYERTYQSALEVGEFDAAGFMGGFGLDLQLELGTHLRVLERESARIRRDLGRWCPKQMKLLLWVDRGVCRALLDAEREPASGAFEASWNFAPEQLLERGAPPSLYCAALVAKALVEVVLGDYASALDSCMRCLDDLNRVFNTWFVARVCVLTAVSHYVLRLADEDGGAEVGAAVERCRETLERWAADAPSNYGHYVALVEGLEAACEGRGAAATRLLDRAWQDARTRGCRWIEGLAAEQLAALLERAGIDSLVDGARRRTWQAYAAWGAGAKLEQLRALDLADESRARFEPTHKPGASPDRGSASSGTSTPAIDLASVLRSVGTITENLRLEEVIERLLDASVTSVGADRGLLVLDQAGELALAAELTAAGERRVYTDPPLLRDAGELAPTMLINFVMRTGQSLVLGDARDDLRFAGDAYLERAEIRSVLALPLRKGDRRLGALVLENRLTTHGFAPSSVEALQLIVSQAVSTLDNAQLYGALHRSEARWRSLVDGAPDLIALLDERGRIVFRNHDGPLIGVDEHENTEVGALDPAALTRWRETVAAVLETGERRELELEYEPRAGPVQHYAVRLAPIDVHHSLSSEAVHVRRNAVAVATDISARRRAEAEKQELEAQLRQQQRLESIGTLASGVAHEINNPIQGIMNYAELIGINSGDAAMVEEFAGEITYESGRVATIVRNLLAFSRQDAAVSLEPVRLDDVVEASLSLVRAVLRGENITLEVDSAPAQPRVSCRVQQIQQVVMNLVTNARDALNERYGENDERKRIEIGIGPTERGGWVRVAVRDYGAGIPADVLPRIFDPFFTTKGRDQGTGLGLAVSHRIVSDHGGHLEVETTLGVGTCFSLELPAC